MRVLVVLGLAVATFASAPPGARAARAAGEAASASSTLTASPEEVHAALLSALREWKIDDESLEGGLVRTAWTPRQAGDIALRDRVVAEHEADGYLTRLLVRHERERRMDELRAPSLGGPAAAWRPWDGDRAIARAVVRSVEQALGQEPAGLSLDSLRRPNPPPAQLVDRRERVVSPEAAVRINRLKARRREIVTEIQAIDERILAAVYDDKLEELRAELGAMKARKAAFEGQVTDIDREILALVLAE